MLVTTLHAVFQTLCLLSNPSRQIGRDKLKPKGFLFWAKKSQSGFVLELDDWRSH